MLQYPAIKRRNSSHELPKLSQTTLLHLPPDPANLHTT